jgi:hypothetical protein
MPCDFKFILKKGTNRRFPSHKAYLSRRLPKLDLTNKDQEHHLPEFVQQRAFGYFLVSLHGRV